ncbi:phospholipase A2 inhibitor subunit gamma B-like [Rana temporaria]|uniref:phospholipase A2 inhibitor subunit gamma B-like n=1 Tax=Rana temporaria TaxID=8407 RepID=UPI001AAC528E|nr:phospholipase A2 inhibitor subunit gamma B-like [Rana temporaria]
MIYHLGINEPVSFPVDFSLLSSAMNSFLAAVCLISGLVTPGCALVCTEGVSSDPSSTGNNVTCSSDLVCISLYQSIYPEPNPMNYFIRGCGEKSICGKSGVMDLRVRKERFSATCCESDYCTPPPPVLPSLHYNENGKSCPFCDPNEGLDCIANKNVSCTGDEDQCALYIVEVSAGPNREASTRGCASKRFCDQGSWKMELEGVTKKVTVKCGASTALCSILTLLILAAASLISNVL